MAENVRHHFTDHLLPDRSGWEPGPWDDEPDMERWVDQATSLTCLIFRSGLGSLCGYVGIQQDHPWFRKNRRDVTAAVHGGLTHSGFICCCLSPADTWWFGFDCAHPWDIQPAALAVARERGLKPYDATAAYRDIGYVRKQCGILAGQIAAARRR